MYAVDVHVEPGALSRQMSEMRTWLDEQRFEPSSFSCHDEHSGVMVSVGFRVRGQAEAFAKRFLARAGRASAEEESALEMLSDIEALIPS
jgi:hypothetical protein